MFPFIFSLAVIKKLWRNSPKGIYSFSQGFLLDLLWKAQEMEWPINFFKNLDFIYI